MTDAISASAREAREARDAYHRMKDKIPQCASCCHTEAQHEDYRGLCEDEGSAGTGCNCRRYAPCLHPSPSISLNSTRKPFCGECSQHFLDWASLEEAQRAVYVPMWEWRYALAQTLTRDAIDKLEELWSGTAAATNQEYILDFEGWLHLARDNPSIHIAKLKKALANERAQRKLIYRRHMRLLSRIANLANDPEDFGD